MKRDTKEMTGERLTLAMAAFCDYCPHPIPHDTEAINAHGNGFYHPECFEGNVVEPPELDAGYLAMDIRTLDEAVRIRLTQIEALLKPFQIAAVAKVSACLRISWELWKSDFVLCATYGSENAPEKTKAPLVHCDLALIIEVIESGRLADLIERLKKAQGENPTERIVRGVMKLDELMEGFDPLDEETYERPNQNGMVHSKAKSR
jgi:hypothetical protein